MAKSPDGPPPPPTVQKLRLRYAKRGRLRFTSHRDFQRAFERAIRRAEVPIAYSAGFSPHPKVSYANAASTGTESEAEYLEIGLAERRDPEAIRAALDHALPPGLDVLEVVESAGGALADRLEASVWRIVLDDVPEATARAAVEAFLAASEVEVERMTKNGLRRFDARSAVLSAVVEPGNSGVGSSGGARGAGSPADSGVGSSGGRREAEPPDCAILQMVVRHVTPAVRPDDVLTGLLRVADLTPPHPPRVTRLAQGLLDEVSGAVHDPLTPDRSG